jgi:diguanylate cyclase (GGDEF)-like protein/PAS domain S-box-containing protein
MGNDDSTTVTRPLIIRHVVVSLVFVLLYLVLNRPEVIFFSRIGVVAWYPAIGLAMALLLGVSPRYALLVCVSDAIAGRLVYGEPVTSFSGGVDAAGIGLCYGTAAYVLRDAMQIDLGLRHRRDVVRYVFVSSVAASGATIIGVACLLGDHSILWGEYKSSAIGWFLGDAIGLIGIAPFFLVHVLPHVRSWLSPLPYGQGTTAEDAPETALRVSSVAELCAQTVTLLAVLWLNFGTRGGHYDHFYLCFVPIIWIAMRQGIRRVVAGLLVLNFGIVVAMHSFPPTPALFVKVALFMLVVSALGLIVGSEVSERHRLALDLIKQTAYLYSLIQNSPLGIIVLDRQGFVELANSAFQNLFEYKQSELDAIHIGNVGIPGDEETDCAHLMSQIFAGRALRRTVRQRRKDGSILDLALYGVPLVLENRVRGAYLIYQDISEQIKASEAQQQHAESLNKIVKELELRTKQMTLLNEMGSLLECSGTVKEAFAVVANSVQKLFPEASSGSLYLFKASRNLIEAVIRWGETGVSESTFLPEACWSLRRGQPHWSDDPGRIKCQHLAQSSKADRLCVPMVAQGNTVGVLHIEFGTAAVPGHTHGTETLRDSHQRLAVSVASQLALSLASLQLREALHEKSIRDPLTHLFNRRFLEESLERELQVAARKKQPLAVLFLDLDHFKRFNDIFGHDAGDMVLQSIADLFRSFFRTTDICCRYGGEEFAIVMPESSARDAAIRADVLRVEVKKMGLEYRKQTLGPITLSAGVAAFPEHATTSAELLALADQCLYKSKSRGRDVVTVSILGPHLELRESTSSIT